MRILELIILAALAAVVLFQLYAVLGRRVGRGPEDLPRIGPSQANLQRLAPTLHEPPALAGALAAIRARDPSFDLAGFLNGARQAFELVVKSFAAGDRATLKPLLSEAVMEGFEKAMAEREAEGRSETVEFLQPPRADFEGLDVAGDVAKASVRFLAEFRSRSTGPEGEAVEDRRTAEIWTFQRNLKSRDPNWLLLHVDAAEA